jgi:threonine dehydrogenase-like Zn-dependent dehydrogenase
VPSCSRPRELTIAERPEPVPGPREVVIETAAVGICGTDTHVLRRHRTLLAVPGLP